MHRLATLLPLLATAFLAGACAQQQAASAPASAAGICQAEPAQFAIGYTYTEAVQEEVRRRSGATVARVIRPGQATTREFRADRVNLETGPGNRVKQVRCG